MLLPPPLSLLPSLLLPSLPNRHLPHLPHWTLLLLHCPLCFGSRSPDHCPPSSSSPRDQRLQPSSSLHLLAAQPHLLPLPPPSSTPSPETLLLPPLLPAPQSLSLNRLLPQPFPAAPSSIAAAVAPSFASISRQQPTLPLSSPTVALAATAAILFSPCLFLAPTSSPTSAATTALLHPRCYHPQSVKPALRHYHAVASPSLPSNH
ncbi:hypothetical protein B296_00009896 [Ensete ventricosum]|uniref:Uncharacterized protein n=1 Tax=Ensete ventricosum TaxID=4639 RepID=A0A426YH55_ENSVE|nr:hypothetical protein B296_00009896 [Ensete ventricosum]